MRECDTCGRVIPPGIGGTTCPKCLLVIVANATPESLCELCGEEISDGEHIDGICADCCMDQESGDDEPDPDDYVQIEEDEPPDEPEEEDLVTEDHMRFYRHGFAHKGPVVTVGEDGDWRKEVKRYMLRERWYPNVWWISDHGNAHLLSLNVED